MTDTIADRIELEPQLKATEAAALLTTLRDNRGGDLTLDASKVEFLSGACAQVLLAARETWKAEGVSLSFDAPSDAFCMDAATLGAAEMLLDLDEAEAG
ncbi:MAG: STAS domain-containing protein [Pseudomonadota bacterium]